MRRKFLLVFSLFRACKYPDGTSGMKQARIKAEPKRKPLSFVLGTALFLLLVLAGFGAQRRGEAAELNFGFSPSSKSWFQVEGGDVHAKDNINSPVPAGLSFMVNPQGVVSAGGSTDFNGQNPQWLVQDPSINLAKFNYDYFYRLLGSPPNSNFYGNSNDISAGVVVYYSSGQISTLGNWKNFSRQAVILVNGNLKIDKEITLGPNGFLAFVVNGNIVIDENVGVGKNSTDTSLEGVYFAQGVFSTGTSAVGGHEKLIAKGIFAAQGGFNLGRDLGDDNETTPAETFIFDPRLLVKMPKELTKSTMSWTEVAP